MEDIKKHANTIVKITKTLKILAVIVVACMTISMVASFVMTGYINEFYQNAANLELAASSLSADMGVFRFINFQRLADQGNYGIYFGVQSLCAAIIALIYVYLFVYLEKIMTSIRDNGYAFDQTQESKTKIAFVIISLLMFFFNGFSTGVIVAIILCALFLTTKAGYLKK